MTGVFPAHAGMSRTARRYLAAANGFPRPRGDEPVLMRYARRATPFSPPTRG